MIIITGASKGIGNFLFNSFQTEEIGVGAYLNSKPSENLDKYEKLNVCDFN
jgi:short-subunit dehydrogenase